MGIRRTSTSPQRRFCSARALMRSNWISDCKAQGAVRRHSLAVARRAYRRGYVVVHGLVSTARVAALDRYIRSLARSGQMCLGDGQCALRYTAYDDLIACRLHAELVPAVRF